jgi:hypothetical protein
MLSTQINVAGLILSTVAAGLMYYFPPRGALQYTDEGNPVVRVVSAAVPDGQSKARFQRRISKLAPALLSIGFALQLLAISIQ